MNESKGTLKLEATHYLEELNISNSSKKLYYHIINKFLNQYTDSSSLQENYDKYMESLEEEGLKGDTLCLVNGRLKNFLETNEYKIEFKDYVREHKRRDYIPLHVIKQLLGYATGRVREEIQMILWTGMRSGELARMQYDDVNFEERVLRVPIRKGGKSGLIPLSRGCLEFLENKQDFSQLRPYLWYPQKRKEAKKGIDQRVIQEDIHRLGRAVLEYNITPHMFRHSYETILRNNGMDLLCLNTILGHKDVYKRINTYYSHEVDPSFIEVQNEFEKYQDILDSILQ